MVIEMLRSKIHRAKITEAELDYEGSITIDSEIMKKAGIIPNQAVEIYNVTNGERVKTYAIEGKPGSKVFSSNGAAARKVRKGDIVIICAYAFMKEKKAKKHKPRIVRLDKKNEIVEIRGLK